MGEEAKQDQAKAEAHPEEKKEEKKEEPKPPSPFVLFVDLHCVGCAKKIEKNILKIRGLSLSLCVCVCVSMCVLNHFVCLTGVEGVVIDMAQNQVTIKGVVEPQAVCTKIMKKTKRRAKVLSPLPAAEGEPIPEVVNSQVSGLTTVELNVSMHCEACAEQLKRKILKMRGVRTATTELSSGKVTVTGTMDADRLVDYVYRRTKKQAKIVPQPEPEKQDAEAKPDEEKKEAEKPVDQEPKPEEKKEEEAADKKDGDEKPPEEENKGGGGGGGGETNNNENKEEKGGDQNKEEPKKGEENNYTHTHDEQNMQRMMYYHQPLYVIERIPPPQLFSDENPNACCIS
uniref:Putative triadin n=1 Tax=Davidia involucrata TaxID=16924 RepID=A0A5B7B0G5_DAVIN